MKKESSYAILAGTCASAASLFGKLAGSSILENLFIIRIISVLLMIICNAGVWTLFVKALQASKSSLAPTIISTASNYLISAVMGFLIFSEVVSLLWWSGLAVVLIGLALIISEEKATKTE